MVRIARFAIAIVCCFAAFPVAQCQDAPPATTRVEKKSRTWTNEDLEKLTGGVSVIGGTDSASAPMKPATKKSSGAKEEEACESDAWVVGVTGVLRQQGVMFPPRFWSERLFGDTCVNNVPVNTVAPRIAGDYTLEDGTKLHLTADVFAGLPTAPEIVSSITERHPLIIKWKGQPLVMTKVDYIDRQYNFVSAYSISSLMLTNVLTGRVLIFDMKTHSEKEIEGTLEVKVAKRK